MFCPNCGISNPNDSKFCESCGSNMTDPSAMPPSAQAAPPPAYKAPPPPVYKAPPPPVYNAPPPHYQTLAADLNKPMGIGGYLGMFAINLIPFFGPLVFFIMLFVWSFGSKANTNKKNLARAILIMSIIMIAVYLVILIVFGAFLTPLFEDLFYSMY